MGREAVTLLLVGADPGLKARLDRLAEASRRPPVELLEAASIADGRARLRGGGVDLVLAAGSAAEAEDCDELRAVAPAVPLVCVATDPAATGGDGERLPKTVIDRGSVAVLLRLAVEHRRAEEA